MLSIFNMKRKCDKILKLFFIVKINIKNIVSNKTT